MKRLLNIITVLMIIVLGTGCRNDETGVIYTRTDGEFLTAIQLFENGKILVSGIPLWKFDENEDLYMCYGQTMLAANYQKADGFAYLMNGTDTTNERIYFEKEGIKIQNQIYKPDKRVKRIEPKGKYGGKCYAASNDEGGAFLVFINDKKLLFLSYNTHRITKKTFSNYTISDKKIIADELNMVFKDEGDERLIMDNDWTTIIFKYKENMDDYTLWDKILSNEN